MSTEQKYTEEEVKEAVEIHESLTKIREQLVAMLENVDTLRNKFRVRIPH